MELVAAAKLRRFQDIMVKARPFTQGLEDLTHRLFQDQWLRHSQGKPGLSGSKTALEALHPFFETREEKNIALVLVTSDTGLCGSYNTDLLEMARDFLRGHKDHLTLIGVGKFGVAVLKKMGLTFYHTFQEIRASRIDEILKELTRELESIYLAKEVDSIYVIYSHFLTISSYKGVIEKLLPLKPPVESAQKTYAFPASDYIYEPSPETVFQKLIPLFFEAKVRMIFFESFVSEQIARMTAMRLATDNAEEMIDSLVLLRNKARQASITKEIIEIISGSRALKIK
jgi:F-type H+-transporting ATPase subunit gamma